MFLENLRDRSDPHSRVLRLGRVLTVVLETLRRLENFYSHLQNAPLSNKFNNRYLFPDPIPLASTPSIPRFRFLQRIFAEPDLAPGVFIGVMEEQQRMALTKKEIEWS